MSRLAKWCAMALTASFVLALVAAPVAADQPNKDNEGKKAEKATMVHEGLQFKPLAEDNPIKAAVVWGDPTAGPSAMVLRLPAGHANPMHTHSATYTAILLEGKAKQWNEGQAADDVGFAGPGTRLGQAAGDYHAELIGDEGPVYVLIYFDGPFDFIPLEEGDTGDAGR